MKTYYLLSRRLPLFSFLGMVAMMVTSCGSYQNSSYYDNDGVYGKSENKNRETVSNDNSQSSKYQEYFSDLNKESEAFTNIENYSSVSNDTVARTTENYNDNNSSWGSNPQSVTINVYDNNWGYGYWNNYWYGNYWGWNSWYGPSWGWGWNSWYGPGWNVGWGGWGGWYSPWYGGYYGYNNWYGGGNFYHTHYNGGRRGGYYNGYAANRTNSSRYGIRNNAPRTYSSVRGNNSINPRNSTFNPSRSNSTFNPTRGNSSNPVRTNTSPVRSNVNSSPRSNTSNPQPVRSNVRSESSSPRSYSPSNSSYGGGRSSGGGGGSYGGGRSGGGGGRR